MQDDIFLKGCIPWWVGVGGYVIFAILAIVVIPFLYTPVRWCAAFLLSNHTFSCSYFSGNLHMTCYYSLLHPCHGCSSAMVRLRNVPGKTCSMHFAPIPNLR